MIQSRTVSTTNCTKLDQNNTGCKRSKFTSNIVKGIHTWNYNQAEGGSVIRGEKADYDSSGYYEDFNVNSHTSFYQSWTKLSESNWIDSDTAGVITIINFYNIHHDLVITISILHELIEGRFKPKAQVSLFDLTPITDYNLYFAIIFSFVNLFSLFTVIRKRSYIASGYRNDQRRPILQRFKEYMSSRFRQPDVFELVSKLNLNQLYLILFFSTL
jgi:hypothetical protein